MLTLWAAAVAERLGIVVTRPELVRGRGDRLGEGEELHVDMLGRAVPVVRTPDGLRAVNKGKPGNPAQIEKYLAGKFGDRLEEARQAMAELAAAYEPVDLYRRGFRLYEQFRPGVPAGESGWGALGELDLAKVRGLIPYTGPTSW